MELKDYVKIIGKHIWLLIVTVLIVIIGAYCFTAFSADSYDGSVSGFVTKDTEKTSQQNYQYDKYYAIQASGLMADNIITWLQDPSNVITIYNTANLNLPSEKISKLKNAIAAKKITPATVNITISGDNEANVKTLLESTTQFITNENKLQNNSDQKNFEVNFSSPTVMKHTKDVALNSAVGFITGIIIGLLIIFTVEYFSPKKEK